MHSEVQQEEVKAAEDVGNEEMKVEENNEEVKQEEVKEEPAGQNEERGEGQPDGPSDPPQNEANSPQ